LEGLWLNDERQRMGTAAGDDRDGLDGPLPRAPRQQQRAKPPRAEFCNPLPLALRVSLSLLEPGRREKLLRTGGVLCA